MMTTGGSALAASKPATPLEELAAEYSKLREGSVLATFDPTGMFDTSLPDESPRAIAALRQDEDRLADRLASIDPETLTLPGERRAHAILTEALTAARERRVCRPELWRVSHIEGWQVTLPELALRQQAASDEAKAQLLARWRAVPRYLATETSNLRSGIVNGYTVPKSVVRRVLHQLDALLALDPERSPFFAPAQAIDDSAFKAELLSVIRRSVGPAMRAYRDFLVEEYLPNARDSLGLAALPEGARCYGAMLRSATTTGSEPQEIFERGRSLAIANEKTIIELGRKFYGTSDLPTIIEANNRDSENRFTSSDELWTFSHATVARAASMVPKFFASIPAQPLLIEALPNYQVGSGLTASYHPEKDVRKPARYVLPLENWQSQTRGDAELMAIHEGWPGHHLQIASAGALARATDLNAVAFNSAFVEGWARYAEQLAEELDIFRTRHVAITRRIWPGRGMVVDTGIHARGWSREKAAAFLIATGRFDAKTADDLIDRVAAAPGQLASYDTGAMVITALRRDAETALGDHFDLREFHQRVLEQGIIPLGLLADHVRAWVADRQMHLRNALGHERPAHGAQPEPFLSNTPKQ